MEKSNDSTWASSGARPSTRARSSRQRRDDTGGLQQRVHAVEHLGTAVQTRQLANGGLDGIGLTLAATRTSRPTKSLACTQRNASAASSRSSQAASNSLNGRTLPAIMRASGSASLRIASATSETISTSPAVSPAPISSKPSCVNYASCWHCAGTRGPPAPRSAGAAADRPRACGSKPSAQSAVCCRDGPPAGDRHHQRA